MRRDLRWITDALQYARYKQPRGGVPITCLVDANAPDSDSGQQKTDSTSSTMDYLPTPSPSPELRRRKAISGESPQSTFILKLFYTPSSSVCAFRLCAWLRWRRLLRGISTHRQWLWLQRCPEPSRAGPALFSAPGSIPAGCALVGWQCSRCTSDPRAQVISLLMA